MSTRSQRVVSVTFGSGKVMQNMTRIRCTLSEEFIISSEHMVLWVGAVSARKPSVADSLRNATRRSQSAADVSPHHAGDA